MVYEYQNEVTMKPVFIDFTIIISNFAIDKSMQKPMGRMMMYRLLIACLLMLLPTMADASAFEDNGIYFYISNGEAVVTNNGQANCYSGEVVIPPTVAHDGTTYPVTAIAVSAFEHCGSLTHVSLPGSLTSIGRWAFNGCSGLTQLTIPDAVTIIEQNVFYGCIGLTSINLGSSVTTIEDDAFRDCRNLTSITIPESVTSIGDYAFDSCTGIKTLVFNAVNCADPQLFSAFEECPLDTIILGKHVQRIPAFLAYGQTQLKSIIIPKSVNSIGNLAFLGCSQLTNVYCLAIVPPALANYGLFDNMDYYDHATLHVPTESLQAYQSANYWKDFSQIIGDANEIIPEDVNGDGEINISDANSVIEVVVNGGSSGGHTRTPDGHGGYIIYGDINGDDEVNIADINVIINMILTQE